MAEPGKPGGDDDLWAQLYHVEWQQVLDRGIKALEEVKNPGPDALFHLLMFVGVSDMCNMSEKEMFEAFVEVIKLWNAYKKS